MNPSLLARERWRAFWLRLKAENIPRLGMLFIACVLVAGVAEYEIETGRNEAFQTLGDGLWWAVVTLTTTGYGDKFPITTPGRLMATVAMLLGMGVVATVTAKIASVMVERRIKEARGLSEATPPSGHLVILGWKPDMPDFVKEVLDLNPELGGGRLTLVNVADEIQNAALRQRFPGLRYVRGDVTDPVALQRANVSRAGKVIILADQAVHRTDEEVDARTVMANLAVKSLASEVYTCAEVLDKKYLEHLQLGRCDEVVLSRQYSRSLLVGATMAAGVTHVIHDLLDFGDHKGLFTEPVPASFVGGTFGALAGHFKRQGQLLVGLLENTGRSVEIKREALREAQKTTNVATLVENLHRVKALQPNRSVLAPPDDHRIGPHTLAVLIGQPRTVAPAP